MKKIFFLFICSLCAIVSKSQSFMHGVGVGSFVTVTKDNDPGIYGGFTYSPRFNVVETESISLSLGIPISAGVSGSYNYSYNSYYGGVEENSIRFMLNAPFLLNVNYGAGSTKENEKRFGLFAGGGFGFHYGDYSVLTEEAGFSYYENKYGSTFGPAANIGFRIAVGSHQKNIETRFSFMKGINNSRTAVYGLGALFNF